jgi:hypothetical protein
MGETFFACWNLSLLCCTASVATHLWLAGGESFPLPASKGRVFPFLLAEMGTPLLPASVAQERKIPQPQHLKLRDCFSRENLIANAQVSIKIKSTLG